MTDFIRRQAVIEVIDKAINVNSMDALIVGALVAVKEKVEELPEADAVSREIYRSARQELRFVQKLLEQIERGYEPEDDGK